MAKGFYGHNQGKSNLTEEQARVVRVVVCLILFPLLGSIFISPAFGLFVAPFFVLAGLAVSWGTDYYVRKNARSILGTNLLALSILGGVISTLIMAIWQIPPYRPTVLSVFGVGIAGLALQVVSAFKHWWNALLVLLAALALAVAVFLTPTPYRMEPRDRHPPTQFVVTCVDEYGHAVGSLHVQFIWMMPYLEDFLFLVDNSGGRWRKTGAVQFGSLPDLPGTCTWQYKEEIRNMNLLIRVTDYEAKNRETFDAGYEPLDYLLQNPRRGEMHVVKLTMTEIKSAKYCWLVLQTDAPPKAFRVAGKMNPDKEMAGVQLERGPMRIVYRIPAAEAATGLSVWKTGSAGLVKEVPPLTPGERYCIVLTP